MAFGPSLTYEQATSELRSAMKFGIHPSLDTIRALTAAMGEPQRAFRSIQVAGTNGKGSTARLAEAILGEHGCRTGAFLSPHFSEYTEQVVVSGCDISPSDFAESVRLVIEARDQVVDRLLESPTEFELMTAAALEALSRAHVEWAILEVGMGGRWDSTSVAESALSVVTSVGMDHADHLGPTLERIAWDKAHVIRARGTGVLGPGTETVDSVFTARADQVGARLVRVRKAGGGEQQPDVAYEVELGGASLADGIVVRIRTELGSYDGLVVRGAPYQAENLACAVAICEQALGHKLSNRALQAALHSVSFAGRFEVFEGAPNVVVDGAHNPEGARALATALREWGGAAKFTVVLGMLDDKPLGDVVKELAPVAKRFIVTSSRNRRSVPVNDMRATAEEQFGAEGVEVSDTVASAVRQALEYEDDVVVTGSLTVAGEARAMLVSSRSEQR